MRKKAEMAAIYTCLSHGGRAVNLLTVSRPTYHEENARHRLPAARSIVASLAGSCFVRLFFCGSAQRGDGVKDDGGGFEAFGGERGGGVIGAMKEAPCFRQEFKKLRL